MSRVVVKECDSYDVSRIMKKVNEGVRDLGGWDKFIKPGMIVLLKVNLIGPKAADTAAVTHSEFVRSMVRILKGLGCTVWIGDSSGGAIAGIAPTRAAFDVSGLFKVAQEEGAYIKNFDREGAVGKRLKDGTMMYLAKPLFDADAVINLPKLKTHAAAMYTGAIKNVFGCIPGLKKAEYHKMAPNPKDFGNVIADIHSQVKIVLHIMDGITAMEGEGPTAGNVFHAGKILLSTDPLALDVVGAKMISMNIDDVPILSTARDRGLGEWELDKIEVTGDYKVIPKLEGFKQPKNFRSTKKRNYGAVVKVIDFLKARPKINKKLCKNCNMCVESCPVHAIDRTTKSVDRLKCIECMCCHELCLQKAVELKRDNVFAGLMMKLYRGGYK